ncbi:ATP-binding protein [Acidithiobacillus thiooxidans]|uniref:ATP-binding protein n=1 Tax=Acidithiobacillus thiooxidans TaxID=930 RepID=UPI00356757FA
MRRPSLGMNPGNEQEQASLRLLMGVVLYTYIYTYPYANWFNRHDGLQILNQAAWVFFSAALLLLASIWIWPQKSILRRVVGMCVDIGMVTYLIQISAGIAGLPLLGLYPWVIIGNGFRFGTRYAVAATGISLIGMVSILDPHHLWASSSHALIATLIMFGILALYMSKLIPRLNGAIEEARKASLIKSQFLAKMSHELRTPLNGVMGMSELLRETPLSAEQTEITGLIQNSSRTLLELIENILDISKIEAGKLQLQPIDFSLSALLDQSCSALLVLAQKKGLYLVWDSPDSTPDLLRGDTRRIRQVLYNLIGNAIKFTEQGGIAIKVRSLPMAHREIRLRFEVIDTGCGLSEAAQEHLFEAFTQVHDAPQNYPEGTGLGTTIAKELVEKMGGQIGVESVPDKGSRFWFELPFQSAEKPETLQETVVNRAKQTPVLILAHPALGQALGEALKTWNIPSMHTDSSHRALELLRSAGNRGKSFGQVFVDQQMMDMAVDHFARIARDEQLIDHTPWVLVSDASLRFDRYFQDMGFSAFLTTPIDKKMLFNLVHAVQNPRENMGNNIVSLHDHYQQSQGKKGLSILVAEDNIINQKVVQGILRQAGHHVRVSSDSEETLDILAESSFPLDLLILDRNMPGKGGLDVLKAYQMMETVHPVPVIMLTADATPESMQACLEAGASAYLTKPVDARMLLDQIARLCQTRAASAKAPAGTTASAAATRPGSLIDESALQGIVDLGGPEFLAEILRDFAQDGEQLLRVIQAALQQEDYPDYQDAIHALKGSSMQMGAHTLLENCLQAEALKPYDMSGAEILNISAALQQTFHKTCRALTAYLDGKRQTR